ncbi:alpha/beta fold hydrolase [Haloechinothrix halophila]|uniref:alpha/beta fold hydrolase n=1 Tax=Haloechinothrix halophila TaxID=1069073 RepID=UPI00040D28C6|nr:alpha/beta fold hydrolase [Haloechinothrix halophila]
MNVNGIHLHTAGDTGSPVLLLHGIGGSGRSFDAQLPELGRGHRAFAWDAPGYGASADPHGYPGMSGYAASVVDVLDGLGADSAHLVGVSWGGVIATRTALLHPDRVRSLVLADSTRGSRLTEESASRMRARARERARLGRLAFARERGPRLTAPHANPDVVEQVITLMSELRLPGYAAAVESMAETDHSDALAHLSVPTLVVVGAQDRVTGVAESRALAEGIPGARLRIIPGGHAANQEHPGEFNAAVREFLSDVDSAVPAGPACQAGGA